MPDELLTVAEVAQLLKLNQQTARSMIDRGELGHVRVGQRRVRMRQSQLDRRSWQPASPASSLLRPIPGRPSAKPQARPRRLCGRRIATLSTGRSRGWRTPLRRSRQRLLLAAQVPNRIQQRPTLVAAYCAWATVYWSPADDESCWMSPWQENDVVCR